MVNMMFYWRSSRVGGPHDSSGVTLQLREEENKSKYSLQLEMYNIEMVDFTLYPHLSPTHRALMPHLKT